MVQKKRSRGLSTEETSCASKFDRLVSIVVVAIIVMTVTCLFHDVQTTHNSRFQALLLGRFLDHGSSSRSLAEMTPSTSLAGYPPFSCPKLLKDLKRNAVMQKLDPNRGAIHARRTLTQPPFYMSLHNKTFDLTRWGIMDTGVYYERKLTEAFETILQKSPPGARILDVGANIGFFSLLSAANGRFVVDSFEPNLKNRMRFCESLSMNRWFRSEFNQATQQVTWDDDDSDSPIVNLYPYGVGQEEGIFVFTEEPGNPGMGSVSTRRTRANNDNGVQIVTLDSFASKRGWFESRPHIAILKIDVEGNEYAVIEGAKELLRTHMVENIFMEVSVRTTPERKSNIPCLQYLSGPAGYRLYQIGGWPGPSTTVNWPNDGQLVNRILDAAAYEGAKQLNLWWTIDSNSTATGE